MHLTRRTAMLTLTATVLLAIDAIAQQVPSSNGPEQPSPSVPEPAAKLREIIVGQRVAMMVGVLGSGHVPRALATCPYQEDECPALTALSGQRTPRPSV